MEYPKYYKTARCSIMLDHHFMFRDDGNEEFNRALRILFRQSVHENLLAFARVKLHVNSAVDDLEKEMDQERAERGAAYLATIEALSDSDEDMEKRGFINYQHSSFVSAARSRYKDLDLEREVAHKGLLISIYSLLEDSLLKFTNLFKEYRNITLTFEEVCKRDKGIFKYIKYLESACGVGLKEFKNSRTYQELFRWNKVRNQFVHVGDRVAEDNHDLIAALQGLDISFRHFHISLSSQNIDQLLDSVDQFLSNAVIECWNLIGVDTRTE